MHLHGISSPDLRPLSTSWWWYHGCLAADRWGCVMISVFRLPFFSFTIKREPVPIWGSMPDGPDGWFMKGMISRYAYGLGWWAAIHLLYMYIRNRRAFGGRIHHQHKHGHVSYRAMKHNLRWTEWWYSRCSWWWSLFSWNPIGDHRSAWYLPDAWNHHICLPSSMASIRILYLMMFFPDPLSLVPCSHV